MYSIAIDVLTVSSRFYNLLWSKDASGMYNSDSQSIEMHDLKKKTDMWSLGVLIYACIAGELPFPATLDGETTVDEHLERALAGPQFDSILWADVSDQCKDVIQKLLHYSPEFRPSVTQIMQHICKPSSTATWHFLVKPLFHRVL